MKVTDNSIDIKRTFKFRVDAPYNKSICPVLEVFLFHYPFGSKELLGTGVYPLDKALGFFYGTEDDRTYQAKWKEFFKVTVAESAGGTREKGQTVNLPNIRPENRILYLDEMVYEMPTNITSRKKQRRSIWKEDHFYQYIYNKLKKKESDAIKILKQNNESLAQTLFNDETVIIDIEDIVKLSEEEL